MITTIIQIITATGMIIKMNKKLKKSNTVMSITIKKKKNTGIIMK